MITKEERKKHKLWCSKHQRVHKEMKHKSCRYPNQEFLPSIKEIRDIILDYGVCPESDEISEELAKAIYKRIGGKK